MSTGRSFALCCWWTLRIAQVSVFLFQTAISQTKRPYRSYHASLIPVSGDMPIHPRSLSPRLPTCASLPRVSRATPDSRWHCRMQIRSCRSMKLELCSLVIHSIGSDIDVKLDNSLVFSTSCPCDHGRLSLSTRLAAANGLPELSLLVKQTPTSADSCVVIAIRVSPLMS